MLRPPFFDRHKHKIFILIAVCVFNSPLFAANNTDPDPDPCDDINGNWNGSFTSAPEAQGGQWCTFDAQAQGAVYKNRVRLVLEVTKGKPNDRQSKCSDLIFAMEGNCHEGKLEFDFGVNGTVFGGYLHVRHGVEELMLQKTPA